MQVLRGFKWFGAGLGIAWLALAAGTNLWAEEQPEPAGVAFQWAFGAWVGSPGQQRLIPISKDTALRSGDQFQMLIEPQSPCFVYLFYLSSGGELRRLFPYSHDQFDQSYVQDTRYYIPEGGMRFELDQQVGNEKFYLLASKQRLKQLEALYRGYLDAVQSEKPVQVKKFVDAVRKLRRQHTQFNAKAERPVIIGGRVRGLEEEDADGTATIDALATDIFSEQFFARTFTIDHR